MKMKIIDKHFNYLFQNIRRYFDDSSKSIHKARNEIKVINYDNQELVIKSFKEPHIINKIAYTYFKDSKAKKSYDNSIEIIKFVPNPIGYIEFRKFGLIFDSYFVSENFNYDFTIREPLLESDFAEKKAIFKQFAKFTYDLHEEDIFHLDYSPGNILIQNERGKFKFKIVDINRMQFKKLDLDERMLNFSKLWAKDNDLVIIIKEYAKLIKVDETLCVELALKYSQKHKDKKNWKKRFKGEKVID